MCVTGKGLENVKFLEGLASDENKTSKGLVFFWKIMTSHDNRQLVLVRFR